MVFVKAWSKLTSSIALKENAEDILNIYFFMLKMQIYAHFFLDHSLKTHLWDCNLFIFQTKII